MADASTFGVLVMKVTADNRELEAGMRQSEAIVKSSADSMTTSITTVSASATRVGDDSDKMTQGLAAAGAAGSLAGSHLGGMASQAAGLGAALKTLGVAMGPISLLMIGIGLAAVALASRYRAAKKEVDSFTDAMEAQQTTIRKVQNELALRQGTLTPAEAALREAQARLPLSAELAEEQRRLDAADRLLRQAQLQSQRTAFRGFDIPPQERSEALTNALADQERLANALLKEDRVRKQLKDTTLEQEAALALVNRQRDLAIQLAIRAGLIQPFQLETDPTSRALVRELAELTGGRAVGGGFSIGSRPGEQFRFGAARPGAEFIGQQNEEAKQTKQLESLNAKAARLLQRLELRGIDLQSLIGGNGDGVGFGGPL